MSLTEKQIDNVSLHSVQIGYGYTLPQTEKEHLIAQLVPCRECQTIDDTEVNHELLNSKFMIWCGCGNSTDAFDTIEEAVEEWKLLNGDE